MKNKKTSKIRSFLTLGFLLIFLTSLAQIALSDVDTTEPQVDDVRLSAEEVNQGETITVYVSASDDISGIEYVYVAIQSPSESQDDILWTDQQNDEGEYAVTFTVSEYAETGRWQIWYIRTTDNAGNRGYSSAEDINLGFVVNEAEEDEPDETEDNETNETEELYPMGYIATWCGKVNMHRNYYGVWETDSDGVSDCNVDALQYCKKIFPSTKQVEYNGKELVTGFRNRGNSGRLFAAVTDVHTCLSDQGSNVVHPYRPEPAIRFDVIELLLHEMETKVYTVNGVDYEVTADYVSSATQAERARLTINDEVTHTMQIGERYVGRDNKEVHLLTVGRENGEDYLAFGFVAPSNVIIPPALPDLSVDKIVHIKNVWANSDDLQIAFKVSNVGIADNDNYYALGTRYTVKSPSGYVKFDENVGNVYALKAGQSKLEHGKIPKDKVKIGDTVRVEIDTSDMIREEREDNNILTVTVTEALLGFPDSKKPDTGWEFDLSDFPNMFFENGEFKGIFVVGDEAPASDILSMAGIKALFQQNAVRLISSGSTEIVPIPVSASKLTSEISFPLRQNTISVGGPCSNKVSGKLMGMLWGITNDGECFPGEPLHQGEAVIKLVERDGYIHLVVAGYGADETRAASKVLANFKDYSYAFTGPKVCVYGTSYPDVTVKSCQQSQIEIISSQSISEEWSADHEVWTETAEDTGDNFEYAEDNPEEPQITEVDMPKKKDCNDNECYVSEKKTCAPIGTRLVKEKPQSSSEAPVSGVALYCDFDGQLKEQKAYGVACQNNYECGSNLCIDGACTSLKGLEETQGALNKLLSAISKLLSFFGL